MTPTAILFISLLTLSQIVYWAQGNKGMRDYLTLLVVGTVIQYYIQSPIVYEIVLVVVELRLLATILSLVSVRWRRNDDFFYSIKCALAGILIDVLLFQNGMVDVINIYLGFQLVVLVLTLFYFFVYDPILKVKAYSFKPFDFEIIRIPYQLSLLRGMKMNDYLLLAILLYSVESILIYRFSPQPMTLEYWSIHQNASIIQAGIFLILGLFYWRKRERII